MRTLPPEQAPTLLGRLSDELAVIENPAYVFPDYELVPLAPKIAIPRREVVAIVQDMDGTTTTTENLCLHSLETMVRRVTARLTPAQWTGLDRARDYPHIIGNSTTKHVEYLLRAYREDVDVSAFRRAYVQAAAWTLATRPDEGRTREVVANLRHFGCHHLLASEKLKNWLAGDGVGSSEVHFPKAVQQALEQAAERVSLADFTDQVRAAIDIYYQRYHEILIKVHQGQGDQLCHLLPDPTRHLIEPMPGVGVFLAAVKGWLGEDLALFADQLRQHLAESGDVAVQRKALACLGRHLQRKPVKVAVVTSSIAYEAEIVLTEVFRVIGEQIDEWPLPAERRRELQQRFSSYRQVFDAVVTASDSSEIRLKPHRDLYSLALHQLGVAKQDFQNVIGFEDSESGLIAIRAAGIGLCVAVPFADTRGHRLDHAAYILHGGLPEALIRHLLFLDPQVLWGQQES